MPKKLPAKAIARLSWLNAQIAAGDGQAAQIDDQRTVYYGQQRDAQHQRFKFDGEPEAVAYYDEELARIKAKLDGLNNQYARQIERKLVLIKLREKLHEYLQKSGYQMPDEQTPRPPHLMKRPTPIEFPRVSPEQARADRLAAKGWTNA